jgi:hypothetical protein
MFEVYVHILVTSTEAKQQTFVCVKVKLVSLYIPEKKKQLKVIWSTLWEKSKYGTIDGSNELRLSMKRQINRCF